MTVRGGAISLAGTAFRACVQISANIVTARILGPDAYGVAAVVLALAVLIELVRTNGFATVVLRSGDLEGPVLVALHRMSVRLGCVLAAAVGCTGGVLLIAVPHGPYGPLLVAIAIAFPLAGRVAVPVASLVRCQQVGRVVAVESVAVVLGAATAVTLAAAGAGPFAMIAQVVVLWAATATGIAALRGTPTGRAAPWTAVRSMTGAARDLSLVQVVSLAARTGDRVLVAAVFSPAVAGLWVQAMQLMTLPLDQIGAAVQRVAVPAFTAAGPDGVRRRYRRIVQTVTLLAWPVLALLGVLAGPVVDLLFGAAWAGSAEILPFLAGAGGAQALGFAAVWYFVASGRSGRQVRWAFVSQPVLLGALVVALPWGVHGMATAYAVVCAGLVVPSFLVATRGSGIRLRDLGSSAVPGALAAAAAVLVALAVRSVAPPGAVAAVLLPAGTGMVAAVLVAAVFPAVRAVATGLRPGVVTVEGGTAP
ncbi:oligosaccharide flippase family protein [Curtobacterium sp. MCLR17_036]|uniref:oligosaccharide flippase family protein n=1 Tax=Curtobacterium sp. MCLR17_036 TaxID=2175620 RepID=UPI0015E8D4A9|nr:oligosaccharide flippase family protein [Curtobacterium sp. MCLR17_036]WIE63933.1 oligosaccharide flippase family protein [Curtobacterium sp. MCLR17_036]